MCGINNNTDTLQNTKLVMREGCSDLHTQTQTLPLTYLSSETHNSSLAIADAAGGGGREYSSRGQNGEHRTSERKRRRRSGRTGRVTELGGRGRYWLEGERAT